MTNLPQFITKHTDTLYWIPCIMVHTQTQKWGWTDATKHIISPLCSRYYAVEILETYWKTVTLSFLEWGILLKFVGLNNWHCGIFFQLSMNFKRGFVKFGLLHMIATNICIWSITVIQEVSGSYLLYKDMTDEFMKSRQAGTGNTKMASGQQGPAYTVDNKGNT